MPLLHRILLGLAVATSLFGILFAQAPSTNHVPDLVIWLVAVCLFLATLWIAARKDATSPAVFVGAMGMLLSLWVIVDVLRHLHSL
jgi:hypothetical protein